MFSREKYINEIVDQLSWIYAQVKLKGNLNLYDVNIHAEYFFCGLINTIFDWNVKNLNTESKNYTAIDLGDEDKRITIQVTSETRREKIQTTIDKFIENKYYQKFDKLIVLIIGKDKPTYQNDFQTSGYLTFSKKDDIWDIQKLLSAIGAHSTEKLSLIHSFFCNNLTPSHGYTGTENASIARNMSTKTQALCLSKLHAMGISLETAQDIFDQEIENKRYQYVLDEVNKGKRYLIGEFGSGKSHDLLLLVNYIAQTYLAKQSPTLPIYVTAKEIVRSGSIQDLIDKHNIAHTTYFLCIDGLDEVSYCDAKQIVEDVNFQSIYSPSNYIIIGSRPLSLLNNDNLCFSVKPLSLQAQKDLYEHINGSEESNRAFYALNSNLAQMLSKPFFCIIYSIFKSEPRSWAKNEMDLVSAFIQKAIDPSISGHNDLLDDLSLIASKSIDLNLGDVHISDLRLKSNLDSLLKTGFLSHHNSFISFTLPIIAQWLAAESIRRKIRNLNMILSDKNQMDRWFYPLSILFSQMTYEESIEYFSSIVLNHPGIASRIIRDGVCFEYAQSLPLPKECAKMMQYCMQTWIKGLGNISPYIAPINGEKLFPLAVKINEGHMTYSWLKLDTDEDILSLSDELFMKTRGVYHSRGVPAQSTWPWIITFDYLSDELKKAIDAKSFILNDSQIQEEAFWSTALHMSNIGELYEKNLEISIFEKYRSYIGKSPIINRKRVDIDGFFWIMEKKISMGRKVISPPYPIGDLDDYKIGTVWSNYSKERCLEKTRFIYSTALSEYLTLSNSIFKTIAEEFSIYQLAPCKMIGGLEYDGEEDTIGPRMTWYFEAAPCESDSAVDIQYKDIPMHDKELFKQITNNHLRYRPDLPIHSHAIISSSRVEIWGAKPVTKIVYDWLEHDLKSIGWIK